MNTVNQYQVDDLAGIDTPSLLAFPRLVENNINAAISLVNNDVGALCPHVKTVKSKEPIEMAVSKGIVKFKCSTIAEAEMLGEVGVEDVLLCYQLSEIKTFRFRGLVNNFPDTRFACLVDNIKSAMILSEVFEDIKVNVFIDVNVGMNRTGIKTEHALELFKDLNQLHTIQVCGFHVYEGHISSVDEKKRRIQSEEAFRKVDVVRKEAEGFADDFLKIVIGGSPTFKFYANKSNVECSPGTIFLWDSGYDSAYSELPFVPAAILLTRIISIMDEHLLCLDLGYKAVASDPPLPRVTFMNIPDYQIMGHYEEHMIVKVPDTSTYSIGDCWQAIPIHICPTVNLYEEVMTITDGKQGLPWKVIARNRKNTI